VGSEVRESAMYFQKQPGMKHVTVNCLSDFACVILEIVEFQTVYLTATNGHHPFGGCVNHDF
jgi:hypothetical protein